MPSSPRAKALERVRLLFDKVLSSPSTEEGRTCAVLAVRIIKEHGFSVVDPSQPARSTPSLADAFRDLANMAGGVGSYGDWPTGVMCVHCCDAIMRSQAYTYLEGVGGIHNKCAPAYAARFVQKDSG